MFKKLRMVWRAYRDWETYASAPERSYAEPSHFNDNKHCDPYYVLRLLRRGNYFDEHQVDVVYRYDRFYPGRSELEFRLQGSGIHQEVFLMCLDYTSKLRLSAHLHFTLLWGRGNVGELRRWLDAEILARKLRALVD